MATNHSQQHGDVPVVEFCFTLVSIMPEAVPLATSLSIESDLCLVLTYALSQGHRITDNIIIDNSWSFVDNRSLKASPTKQRRFDIVHGKAKSSLTVSIDTAAKRDVDKDPPYLRPTRVPVRISSLAALRTTSSVR